MAGSVCVRWQAPRGAGWGCPSGRNSGALPSADGDLGRRPDRRGPARAHARAVGPSERLPNADLGYPGRHDRARHSEGAAWNFPSLLQPRRGAEHALRAVVQEAYVHGVSTRKVDELMKALGLEGVSKSEVSRICGELDPLVEAFRSRALTTEYPYIWVDATYHKVRVNGGVTSQATVVAVGVTSDGERQVLGIDGGPSEDRAFWTAFLRSLVKRGLRSVRQVTSDAHEGLKQAIATC